MLCYISYATNGDTAAATQQTPFLGREEDVKEAMWKQSSKDRRYYVGGSDARVIMGADESALLRLWQEKRGEAEPEDLSGNLIVQLGVSRSQTSSARFGIRWCAGW